ncbi:MAG: hypothetical protein JW737_02330 [Acidobacteria bacterium]|nr:hypothetical protein [Acidobacteriota bacterium]
MKLKEFEAKAYLYLRGELEPKEEQLFKETLEKNPQYARLLDTYSNILKIHGSELIHKSSKLRLSLPQDRNVDRVIERRFRLNGLRFAAFALVIVLLITTGIVLLSLRHNQQENKISAEIAKTKNPPALSTDNGAREGDTKTTHESSFRKEDSLVSVVSQVHRKIEPLPPLSRVIMVTDEKQGNIIFIE